MENVRSCCWQIAYVKCSERSFQLLKQKSECLYDMRDVIEEEIVKELMQGNVPTKECQIWLKKAREIECHINNILNSHRMRYNVLSFSRMKLHTRLRDVLSEVTYHLEKSPLAHSLIACSVQGISNTTFSPRIEGGQVKKTKASYSRGENRESLSMSSQKGKGVMESFSMQNMQIEKNKEKLVDPWIAGAGPEVEQINQAWSSVVDQVMPWEKAEKLSTIRMQGDTTSTISGDFVAATEHVIKSPPERRILPVIESEIDLIHSETEGSISAQETAIVVINSGVPNREIYSETEGPISSPDTEISGTNVEKEWIASVHEDEITMVMPWEKAEQLSTVEVEGDTSCTISGVCKAGAKYGQIRYTFGDERLIEPDPPVAIRTSRKQKKVARVPVKTSISRKKKKNLPIKKEKDEVSLQTERTHVLLEPMVNAETAIQRNVAKILEYVNDVTTKRIGICGIGGIGKTSALKALMNHVEERKEFDIIIWVTISRYWSMRKIQNKVLRQLSLRREEFEIDLEVALKLCQELKGRKYLFLLDDVWERIDLNLVGISDDSLEDGSKVILGTRSKDVCRIMAMDKEIQMEFVSSEEAWKLFQDQVGKPIYSPDIQPIAKAIVEACSGLPLLIIVTGSALRKETQVSVWKDALTEILLASKYGIYGTQVVVRQFKFSYERLGSHDIKSCFLYSALFSEDQEIDISELVECFIHDSLVAGNWDHACKRGHYIIDVLVGASLLQRSPCGHSIKMHDMIRDTAAWILSSESESCQFLVTAYPKLIASNLGGNLPFPGRNKLLNPEGDPLLLYAGAGLTEPPLEEKKWEQAKMIVLMDNELSNLPNNPSCPQLLTLFLQRNYCLRVIPMSFFDFMPSLMILNLSKTRIKFLPQSLSKLKSLQVLILRDCERLDMLPSEIGCLKLLEVLDLLGTEINKLPDEIRDLASLRHLEVSFYGSSNRSEYFKLPRELVSDGIISNLVGLETLNFSVYPGDRRWNKSVKSIASEVGTLEKLTNLCFYFPEVELLKFFLQTSPAWNAQSLIEFKIVVGHDFKRFVSRVPDFMQYVNGQQGRCLKFVNGDKITDAIVTVLARTTAFYLDHHLNVHSLLDFGVDVISGLKLCVVRECPKMEIIIDNKELTEVFPLLEHLSVHYLWSLMMIWKGILPKGSFASLRILSVHTCPKLEFVLTSTMLHCVSKLEELVVEDCQAIIEIIREDEQQHSPNVGTIGLKKLSLHHLPELVDIWKGEWPLLESMSIYNCPNVKNIGMDSKLKDSIKEIKAEKKWWEDLEWKETSLFLHLQTRFTAVSEDDLEGNHKSLNLQSD